MTRIVSQVMVVLWATLSTEFVLAIGRRRGFSLSAMQFVWLQVALLGVFTVVVHETGHWLAGRVVGWPCLSFRVGPLRWRRAAQGWRPQWTKLEFGGAVACYPRSYAGFVRSLAWFTGGGPLASIFQGVLCAFVASQAGSPAEFWFFAFAAHFGFGGGVFALLPMATGFRLSDGAKLLRICRGGSPVDELKRMYLINTSAGTALRPRDWPRDMIQPVLDSRTPCSRHDRYLAYVHLLDAGDVEAAYPWLALYAPGWSKADPYEYAVEAAYYVGVYEKDEAAAALWVSRALKDKTISRDDRLRAGAALAWASGRPDEATRMARTALLSLEEEFPSGLVEYRRARLNHLLTLATAEPVHDAMIVG